MTRIQVRRGTAAQWTSVNPILAAGEHGFETDTGKEKIGDGATAWVALSYVTDRSVAKGGEQVNLRDAAGVVGDGVTDDATALQAAQTAAEAAGKRTFADGTFKIGSTFTIKGDCDLGSATFNYTGATGVAISVGSRTTTLTRKRITCPKVVNVAKTVNGWAQVAGSIGVEVVNAYTCTVDIPYVQHFETGWRTTGYLVGGASQGTQQCTFFLGHLDNNKINMAVTPLVGTGVTDSGWANQNTVIGGRMSHNSGEGTQVSGVRHMLFADCPNIIDTWVTYGTSIESPNVVEYHIEMWGQQCLFDNARFENTGFDPSRRILSSGVNAKLNMIRGGYASGLITQVLAGGAQPFNIDSDVQQRRGGYTTRPTLLLENPSNNTSPALTVMDSGAGALGSAPATAYVAQQTSLTWSGKRAADANPRIQLDHQNGRIYLGGGTAALTGYFSGTASAMLLTGVPFCAIANTQDLGSGSLFWRDLYANQWVRPQTTQTISYALLSSDNIVLFNGASLTATLPTPAAGLVGRVFVVKNLNASALTVVSAGTSKTLDGAASQSLAQWAKASYVTDGTQWYTI